MAYIQIIAFFLLLCSPTLAEPDKQIKKFEDLFIWKVAEDLKLTQKEEAAVGDVIRDVSQRKAKINDELDLLYKKLRRDDNDTTRKATLKKIKDAHKAQAQITIDELDRMEKGIGLKKLAQYLEVKQELADKIKSIWLQNDQKSDKKLPPPKVIEEK